MACAPGCRPKDRCPEYGEMKKQRKEGRPVAGGAVLDEIPAQIPRDCPCSYRVPLWAPDADDRIIIHWLVAGAYSYRGSRTIADPFKPHQPPADYEAAPAPPTTVPAAPAPKRLPVQRRQPVPASRASSVVP